MGGCKRLFYKSYESYKSCCMILAPVLCFMQRLCKVGKREKLCWNATRDGRIFFWKKHEKESKKIKRKWACWYKSLCCFNLRFVVDFFVSFDASCGIMAGHVFFVGCGKWDVVRVCHNPEDCGAFSRSVRGPVKKACSFIVFVISWWPEQIRDGVKKFSFYVNNTHYSQKRHVFWQKIHLKIHATSV